MPLPRAEGGGGSAKAIRDRLGSNLHLSSTSNIEVESYHAEYNDVTEFATLELMNFEVFPAE